MNAIEYWNREKSCAETEAVYGGEWMQRFYGSEGMALATGKLLANKLVSQLYGAYKASSWSARAIPQFIEAFRIPMEEYEEIEYKSFNDFFIRRFKPGARPFTQNSKEFPAPAEARYLAFAQVEASDRIPIKGVSMTAAGLLAGASETERFLNGPCLLARLCPVDYHRFHFPDHGKKLRSFRIPGKLHSVNPLALAAVGDVLHTNERVVTFLETRNFGLLAYIEVGALCVGKIIESHPRSEFKRGEEKGYFLFGGSTVIVLGEAGKWTPDQDLLERSARGQETLVKLGTRIGTASL